MTTAPTVSRIAADRAAVVIASSDWLGAWRARAAGAHPLAWLRSGSLRRASRAGVSSASPRKCERPRLCRGARLEGGAGPRNSSGGVDEAGVFLGDLAGFIDRDAFAGILGGVGILTEDDRGISVGEFDGFVSGGDNVVFHNGASVRNNFASVNTKSEIISHACLSPNTKLSNSGD
jgi:hypothetical protein